MFECARTPERCFADVCVCCRRIHAATCSAFTFINMHLSAAVPLIYLVKVYQPTRTDVFASASALCMGKGSCCDKLRKNEAADKPVLCVPCLSSLLHMKLQSFFCLRPCECGCRMLGTKQAPVRWASNLSSHHLQHVHTSPQGFPVTASPPSPGPLLQLSCRQAIRVALNCSDFSLSVGSQPSSGYSWGL